MNDELSIDEYAALGEIASGRATGRPSACVARNTKRLTGVKIVSYAKDGSLMLTDKGKQVLFLRQCIEAMRALAVDPMAAISRDVQTFLGKKGHVVPRVEGGFTLSTRGRESLTDIENRER